MATHEPRPICGSGDVENSKGLATAMPAGHLFAARDLGRIFNLAVADGNSTTCGNAGLHARAGCGRCHEMSGGT